MLKNSSPTEPDMAIKGDLAKYGIEIEFKYENKGSVVIVDSGNSRDVLIMVICH